MPETADLPMPRDHRVESTGSEVVLKNLSAQLLSERECLAFKHALHNFRSTRSVPSLCTSLRPLITTTERLILLVELGQQLPSQLDRSDFHKLCTLHYPKYHTFVRYFSPHNASSATKVIAQDSSGQLQLIKKGFEKTLSFNHKQHPPQEMNPENAITTDAISTYAESGIHSMVDNSSRLNNGVDSIYDGEYRHGDDEDKSRSTYFVTSSQSGTARGTLLNSKGVSHSTFRSSSATPTNGNLLGGTLKIVSGSFQNLNGRRPVANFGGEKVSSRQKRILLERRQDGSLGVGIKGGKENGTPIMVSVVEPGSQAYQQGLRVGDRILDVNGTDFTDQSHAQAVILMRNAWNIIMTVESNKSTENGRVITEDAYTELDLLVKSDASGKLGISVHRVPQKGEIVVQGVEENTPASKAGIYAGDTISEIDGKSISTLSDQEIGRLTSSKQVHLRVMRKLGNKGLANRTERETVSSDDVFSPLDFSSPFQDDDIFKFPASSSEQIGRRSRSAERILTPPPFYPFYSASGMMRRSETSPELPVQHADVQRGRSTQRIYRQRAGRSPAPTHLDVSTHSKGGGGGHSGTRGRTTVRHIHAVNSPHYSLVYYTNEHSGKMHLALPDQSKQGQHPNASPNMTRFIRNRSKSRESTVHVPLTASDPDLLSAVQSGVEKRQHALRLSFQHMPEQDDDDWRF